tara:strand:+ start:230 stop:583 length:354 start_codon:yes stop_codon:yes gene_type:complete
MQPDWFFNFARKRQFDHRSLSDVALCVNYFLALRSVICRFKGLCAILPNDADALLGNLILLNFLNSFLVEFELKVNFFLVADVRLTSVLPDVLVNFSMLVLFDVVVNDDVLESVREV